MNILFLIPPTELNAKKVSVDRVYGCNYGFDYKPAIHLLTLATIAKQLGHSVRLLDCPAEEYNLKKFIDYINNKSSPDIVVFFTVWLSKREDLLAAEIIHSLPKKAKIIFTGPYPTWKPELFLENNNFFVIRGEPEGTFQEVIENIDCKADFPCGIKGLSFLSCGQKVDNMHRPLLDINTIPIPDRSLLKGKYAFNRLERYPATVLCVSRGCSHRCTFCAPHALDQAIELEHERINSCKPPLRLRSIDAVVSEFQEIASLGYQGVEICDNQFVWDKKITLEICKRLEVLKLKWICYSRADYLKDKEMLTAMRRAGCELIYIGADSFVQEILDDIKKDIDLKTIYEAIELVKECGIEPEISVLFGASGLENENTIDTSIQSARRISSGFVHYSIACPLPNTGLYKLAKTKGWIKGEDFIPVDNIRECLLDLPSLSSTDLKRIIRTCYRRQYLSMRFIMKQFLRIRFWKGFIFKLKALKKLIKYLEFRD